ncbi:MAG: DUF1697 domain-containing protein [Bergeyella sp.]
MNYCAFLRGVNVKGTSMKMADVCAVFEKLGMEKVSSVLASGNILFQSDKPAEELKKMLESAMSERFGYEAYLFIRNEEEIRNMLEKSPFEKKENFHLYVFVANPETENILREEFEKVSKQEGEKAEISGGIFYWQVQKGNTLDSEFGKILGRKSLKAHFTSRNINTFEKIINKLK